MPFTDHRQKTQPSYAPVCVCVCIKSSNFPGVKNINKRAEPPREDFQQGKMREGFSSESNHGGKASRSDQERRKGIAWTEVGGG